MEIVIGTREGVFVAGGSGAPMAADGLEGRGVLTLCRVNGGVFAGTDAGVYRSSDGRTWQASGIEGRAIRAIATAPGTDGKVYAGTQPAALYRSGDGGSSWDEIESLTRIPGSDEWGLPGDPSASRALAIVFDSKQPAHCWVGVEVGGIMETQDGGATWHASLADKNPDIHALARDPVAPACSTRRPASDASVRAHRPSRRAEPGCTDQRTTAAAGATSGPTSSTGIHGRCA